jgi:hypothetical protein
MPAVRRAASRSRLHARALPGPAGERADSAVARFELRHSTARVTSRDIRSCRRKVSGQGLPRAGVNYKIIIECWPGEC